MDRNESSLTVLFQPPFWVGIAQRWTQEGYQAAKETFGPEPSDAQIYQWVLREWHKLRFSRAAAGEAPQASHKNPKRVQREAREATKCLGAGTKAQETLSRQREQEGLLRQSLSRERRQEEAERKFRLHQQKKREKKRGR
ncbi:MAG: YjdF family protein [Lawsonibacter sp.]|nr:YjdF family protein [Lawsonibacter sp.]